jgi:hypothetical protein
MRARRASVRWRRCSAWWQNQREVAIVLSAKNRRRRPLQFAHPRGACALSVIAWCAAACVDARPPTDADDDGGVPEECVPGDLGPLDHFTIGVGDGIDIDSTAIPRADGRVLVVYERYDEAFTTGRLMSVTLAATDLTPSAPVPIDLGNEAYVSAPAIVQLGASHHLYFAVATSLQGVPTLFRTSVDETTFGERQPLQAIPEIAWLLSWPRFTALPDGQVGVAFHDGTGRPSYASSTDGVQFGSSSIVDTQSRAMAKVHAFEDGALAFTYQTGVDPMVSFVRIGSAAQPPTWTDAITVSALANIHDTSAVIRRDGDLDLYYISTSNAPGFRLHRRALLSDGQLGPETQVTFDASGEVSKPKITRLNDCRLLITYAEITERDGNQLPVRQRLGAVVLVDDAPLP